MQEDPAEEMGVSLTSDVQMWKLKTPLTVQILVHQPQVQSWRESVQDGVQQQEPGITHVQSRESIEETKPEIMKKTCKCLVVVKTQKR